MTVKCRLQWAAHLTSPALTAFSPTPVGHIGPKPRANERPFAGFVRTFSSPVRSLDDLNRSLCGGRHGSWIGQPQSQPHYVGNLTIEVGKMLPWKKKNRRVWRSFWPLNCSGRFQAPAIAAAFFGFRRQPSSPNPTRPEVNGGTAPGRGAPRLGVNSVHLSRVRSRHLAGPGDPQRA